MLIFFFVSIDSDISPKSRFSLMRISYEWKYSGFIKRIQKTKINHTYYAAARVCQISGHSREKEIYSLYAKALSTQES